MDLLDKVLAQAGNLPQKQISMATFGVGAITAAYLSAQITWQLIPVASSDPQWTPTAMTTAQAEQVDIEQVKQLQLFGEANKNADKPKQPEPVAELITDAPKTSLSIQLTGVVASTIEKKGLAVIASGGKQDTYSLGDKIKSTSASLKEVYADRVIITNNGRYETLMLDGVKYDSNSSANQQLQSAKFRKLDQRKNKAVAQKLKHSKDELLADPGKITDYLSISPVRKGGKLQGYRLNPGKDRQLFTAAGLKSNDLAKSINGYDLTDMSQALEVMAALPEMTEVSLMIERNGQLIEIMFSLPQ